jgi:hypothetical protein
MRKPDLDFSSQEIEQYLDKQHSGDMVSSIYCFYLFDDYLFISYDYRNRSNYVISRKNEIPLFIGKFDLDQNGLYIIPVTYFFNSSKSQLVTLMDTESLAFLLKDRKDHEDSSLIQEMINSIENTTDDNNPILVFYDWIYKNK